MTIQTLYPDIKPTLNLDFANVEALDPRITFTRASSARYYDGKTVAKAEENLLLRSQEFNLTWSPITGMSITADAAVAPDGTTTADTLAGDGTSSVKRVAQLVTPNGACVFSCFVKKNTNDFIQFYFSGDNTSFANFNVSTGVVGTTGGTVTSSIIDAGNGWYRCIAVNTSTAVASVAINLTDSASAARAQTTTLSTSVFLWGAQLEQRSSVTAYTATTTQPITNYIPVLLTATDNVARFDHNPTTGESLGLLVEEQRTNLLTYSSQFDDAAWTKGDCSITSNTIVAPDGTLTGDKLVENTATASHFTSSNAIPTSGSPQVFSVYAKAAEQTKISLAGAGFTGQGFAAIFNLATGTMEINTGSKGAITSVGNGWYRCSIAFTPSNTVPYQIQLVDASNNITYTGNGYSGVFIWGAQLESGSFGTSYIPTVASQVTRSADAASMTGANFTSWFNQGGGTIYAEALTFNAAASNNNGVWTISAAEFRGYSLGIRNPNNARFYKRDATVDNQVSVATFTNSLKAISTILPTSTRRSVNGGVVNVESTFINNAPMNALYIGWNLMSGTTSQNYLGGYIKKISYYPVILSDTNLQALTA